GALRVRGRPVRGPRLHRRRARAGNPGLRRAQLLAVGALPHPADAGTGRGDLMSPRTRVWLEAWPRWAPPLAALLVAGLVLLLYPLRYADRIERLAGEAQSLQEQIDELAERRRQLEERMDWRRQGDAGADRLL